MTKKKMTQIKRCMTHIFEFYEETFPEHSLAQQTNFNANNLNTLESADNSGKSERTQATTTQRGLMSQDYCKNAVGSDLLTSPSDVDTTPNKEVVIPKQQN